MTTEMSYSGAPPARHTGAARAAVAVLGVLAVAFGGFLLFNPYEAARTLALLFGLALLIGGLLEVAEGWDSERRWAGVVLGGILVVGGLLAMFWPAPTLWVLALVTGLSLIFHGLARLTLAFVARAEITGWGWLALAGAVNVLVGLLAIAWPDVTVLVLSLILGAQILIFGAVLLVVAFWRPKARSGAGTF
jgi:uncharacterized membrane protein HdeD (DUF308 family)